MKRATYPAGTANFPPLNNQYNVGVVILRLDNLVETGLVKKSSQQHIYNDIIYNGSSHLYLAYVVGKKLAPTVSLFSACILKNLTSMCRWLHGTYPSSTCADLSCLFWKG